MKVQWRGAEGVTSGVGHTIRGNVYDLPEALALHLIEEGFAEELNVESVPCITRLASPTNPTIPRAAPIRKEDR